MTTNSSATSASDRAARFDSFAFSSGAGSAPRDDARNFALGLDGFRYSDLFEPARLRELDARFRSELEAADPALSARFEAYRAGGGSGGGAALTPPEESELLIAVGRVLGPFVARLFRVETAHAALLARAEREQAIFRMKHFVVRRASKKYPQDALPPDDPVALRAAVRAASTAAGFATGDDELDVAAALEALLARE